MTKFEFQRKILKRRELRFGDKKLSTFQIGSKIIFTKTFQKNVDKSETSPYITKMSIHCIKEIIRAKRTLNPGRRRTESYPDGRYFENKISRILKYTFHPRILLDPAIDHSTVGTNKPTIYHDFQNVPKLKSIKI